MDPDMLPPTPPEGAPNTGTAGGRAAAVGGPFHPATAPATAPAGPPVTNPVTPPTMLPQMLTGFPVEGVDGVVGRESDGTIAGGVHVGGLAGEAGPCWTGIDGLTSAGALGILKEMEPPRPLLPQQHAKHACAVARQCGESAAGKVECRPTDQIRSLQDHGGARYRLL